MITIREATGQDVAAIREIFLASYGTDYTDPRYYDDALLTRLVYSDDSLLLVAEDTETGGVVGTASVDLEVGAHSDLVGEFCRLAVHPDVPAARHRQAADERTPPARPGSPPGRPGRSAGRSHPYSLRIAEAHSSRSSASFPKDWRLRERESLALLVRYFGNALELRNNHPRIIPEVHPLAHMALENCSLPPDAIVDEDAPAYPPGGDFEVQELTTEGYAALLRIERGRVRHREIFGPVRLHYGHFQAPGPALALPDRARGRADRRGGRLHARSRGQGRAHLRADRPARRSDSLLAERPGAHLPGEMGGRLHRGRCQRARAADATDLHRAGVLAGGLPAGSGLPRGGAPRRREDGSPS